MTIVADRRKRILKAVNRRTSQFARGKLAAAGPQPDIPRTARRAMKAAAVALKVDGKRLFVLTDYPLIDALFRVAAEQFALPSPEGAATPSGRGYSSIDGAMSSIAISAHSC